MNNHTLTRPLENCSFLVVDDSFADLRLFKHLLHSAGASVTTTETPGRACSIIDEGEQFDVVITDHEMPIMTGLELVLHLRAKGYTGKVIAVSGSLTTPNLVEWLDAGADELILKPVKRREFLRKIESCVRDSQVWQQPAILD
ncbi:response regulator [Calycomorphotria hydatis]|uniref:Regulator of RpoS n=1 Tax=Calycomorphotria hydatis TaxID=2528027 RepID=A0A517T523_9PLAN|nr:response regulator [Calycomorphotria hydatis]QDT63482.1 Regulator of RpoS [Calycomorphotria hydatis]